MSELTYVITSDKEALPVMMQVQDMASKGLPSGPVQITVGRPEKKRSNDQNRKLWAVLRDVSEQVNWYGRHLPDHAWKSIFTAALERQDVVPGLEGGFVMIGGRTSKMSKKRFADLLTLIDAFGAERGIAWSDPSLRIFDEYKEAV